MNPLLWTMLRAWIRVRRARVPPARVPDPVWYFACGSNMNERLFRERRHMTPLETRLGRLPGFRLCFTVGGGRRPGLSAPANITPDREHTVHGVLYLLPLRKFARLDLWVDVSDADGTVVPAVTFRAPGCTVEGRPSLAYLRLVREAARERGLPAGYTAFLDAVEPRD